MILKRGVTGYTAGDVTIERDWAALGTSFKRASYAAVQQAGGRVLAAFEPDVTIAYWHIHAELNDETFYIFYNAMYHYIAFSSTNVLTDLQFIDVPTLAAAFSAPYEVLAAAQLQEPLRKQKKGRRTYFAKRP